jgi:hypothetical protein
VLVGVSMSTGIAGLLRVVAQERSRSRSVLLGRTHDRRPRLCDLTSRIACRVAAVRIPDRELLNRAKGDCAVRIALQGQVGNPEGRLAAAGPGRMPRRPRAPPRHEVGGETGR